MPDINHGRTNCCGPASQPLLLLILLMITIIIGKIFLTIGILIQLVQFHETTVVKWHSIDKNELKSDAEAWTHREEACSHSAELLL